MTPLLTLVSFGMVLGYLTGGRLSNLSHRHVRWPGMAVAGLALQVIPAADSDRGIMFAPYLGSFVLLLGFAALNVRAPGFWLVVIGLAMNLTVIAVNHGMPVSQSGVQDAGQLARIDQLASGHDRDHHLAGPGDRLLPAGRRDRDPLPVRNGGEPRKLRRVRRRDVVRGGGDATANVPTVPGPSRVPRGSNPSRRSWRRCPER